ncbi:uncharacterized protein HMPREF1541_05691 [Cyphellophora europaea CBS 101466]|uniref:Uncharacterized protein n=1 Tax=Cyphellophora europaea (strain CBS 101466) TaxID=1220924 RepID=W2RSQ2_CYPE1|nr:uncharacterized protein HMPREF1541_05691 [Cyphellophora europaea CBS 101466]ETN39467.1 hypothetical protein HMPREF1541_05691 [Cyphellophora europaea CBS 101466]
MAAELQLANATSHTSTSSSPNLLPTPISSCFSESRSVSGISSISSQSNASDPRRSVSGSTSRRRGYVRPQGANFAHSAQQRESVMSLGSIAHLQYYFARTGLLDGKGGQMAKKKKNGEYDIPKISDRPESESPLDEEVQMMWEAMQEDGEDIMLPPTVSTYSHRQQIITPLPDQKSLKRELVEALENSLQAIEACERTAESDEAPTQGFHEVQGLHVLDTTTLAIKAARDYYTQHPNPERLSAVRPVQQLRKELYSVLEVLKKCAARNFVGGFKEDERLAVLIWVSDVGMMIDQEAKLEEKEKKERKDWGWMEDAKWAGNETGRDLNFLHFLFKKAKVDLPSDAVPPGPEFFRSLADGRDLNRMHNVAVKESKRQFNLIDSWHEDTAKPYRRADNLRFWVKAAELRWEVKLKFDVMGVANQKEDDAVWDSFEAAIRSWAQHVRAELTKDWNGEEERRLHARAKSLALASPMGSPAKRHAAKMGRDLMATGSPGPSPSSSTASLNAAVNPESEEIPPVPPIPTDKV